jgi:hypothetical protein
VRDGSTAIEVLEEHLWVCVCVGGDMVFMIPDLGTSEMFYNLRVFFVFVCVKIRFVSTGSSPRTALFIDTRD